MNGLLTGKHERILALFRKLDHMTDRLGSPEATVPYWTGNIILPTVNSPAG